MWRLKLRLIPLAIVSRSLAGLSATAAGQLVDSLYDQTASMMMGAGAMVLVGIIAYLRTHSIWFLLWSGLSLALTMCRLALCRAYRRHRDAARSRAPAGDVAPVVWARRFFAGAWMAGALWGLANLVIVLSPDPFIHFLVITVQTAWALGGAVRLNALPAAALGQVSLVIVPMFVVCLLSGDPFYQAFSVFVVLQWFACLSMIRFLQRQTLRLLRANEEKTALNRQLENLAVTDMLTAITNRRGFDVRLAQEWRRLRRERRPLSLLLLDVDHFKQFNDLYGHPAGDECLRLVAETIELAIRRPGDIAARWGGEEFAVILLDTDPEGAARVAETVRAAIEALAIPHGGCSSMRVTASIGVATVIPTPEISSRLLIGLADEALYQAKHQGRNRICCVTIPTTSPSAELGLAVKAMAPE